LDATTRQQYTLSETRIRLLSSTLHLLRSWTAGYQISKYNRTMLTVCNAEMNQAGNTKRHFKEMHKES